MYIFVDRLSLIVGIVLRADCFMITVAQSIYPYPQLFEVDRSLEAHLG